MIASATRLPEPLTSFVGRQREVPELRERLAYARLLTLVGVGGIGKTRLAIEIARCAATDFPDGVTFVDLAWLSRGDLVAETILARLGLSQATARTALDSLVATLRTNHILLVLDNCEHVVQQCAEIVHTLLENCPTVRILATSREALRVPGEVVRHVPALSTPTSTRAMDLEQLAQFEAIALFRARAAESMPGFQLTEENIQAVADVCAQLDGIPLAVELAAARLPTLMPAQLVNRLQDRFRLLVHGSRTVHRRQQTLRATVDWSYDLLGDAERLLFDRLACFAGGCSLEAVEAICGFDDVPTADVLEILSSLVNKSLVVAEPAMPGDVRFRMLETLRQYARQRLTGRGEEPTISRRHAHFFLSLAERAESELRSSRQQRWLDHLERERDNLRVALAWAIDGGDVQLGLRLAAALAEFWRRHGYIAEGEAWLERALEQTADAPPALRAAALYGVGNLARFHDPKTASGFFSDSAELRGQIGDEHGRALSLTGLGSTLVSLGPNQSSHAKALLVEALQFFRGRHDEWATAACLSGLGNLALSEGSYALAAAILEDGREVAARHGDAWQIAYMLHGLGHARWMLGETEQSIALLKESLAMCGELGDRRGVALCLQSLGLILGSQGSWHRSARLYGAAARLREIAGLKLWGQPWIPTGAGVERARSALGEAKFRAAWRAGGELSFDDAVRDGLNVDHMSAPAKSTASDALTRREREVARLVARGLTNRQIGAALVITEGTAGLHVKHVLSKLGFVSRAQIAAWASSTGNEELSRDISIG